MKKLLTLLAVLLLAASTAFAQTFGTTAGTSLSVTVGAEASISADTSTGLTTSSTIFADYGATTNFTYKVRTGGSNTTAGITLEITKDFGTAANEPSVANSGGSSGTGDTLTYTCTVATSSATPCSGTKTASTVAGTPVATFGKNANSTKNGDTGSVIWDLVNDPAYAVGTYTATATFTISAT
jgi:hypothetical protein